MVMPTSSFQLQARGLSVSQGTQCLMHPLDIALHAGECLCVIGESGAGKSLLLQALMGLLPPGLQAQGEVTVWGRSSAASDTRARQALWGRDMALLPQEPAAALDALRTLRHQLDRVHRHGALANEADTRQRTEQALGAAGLQHAADHHPWQLSGGMAQRAATRLALAAGAQVLLADEPSKGLDADSTRSLIGTLNALLAQGGTLVVVTHDLRLVQALPGQVMVMRHGCVVEQGPTRNVLQAPQHAFTRQWLAAAPAHWPRPPMPASDQRREVLRAHNLRVQRGGRTLAEGVNLGWQPGQCHVVQGPSGCGKSSLGDALLGLLAPEGGWVELAPGLSPWARQKLYQDPVQAFPPAQALDHHLREVAGRHGMPWAQVLQWLQACGLEEGTLRRRARQVSGGELQRVAMARALCARPAFLFADEPTSRLDPLTQQHTCHTLRQALKTFDTALLWVTHDDALARALSPAPRAWETLTAPA